MPHTYAYMPPPGTFTPLKFKYDQDKMSETGTAKFHTLAIFCFCMPVRINKFGFKICMELARACVRACVCACVRACVCMTCMEEQESAFILTQERNVALTSGRV